MTKWHSLLVKYAQCKCNISGNKIENKYKNVTPNFLNKVSHSGGVAMFCCLDTVDGE